MSNLDKNEKFINFSDSDNHTVFYKFNNESEPTTFPDRRINKWDNDHVRMPCSPLSFHPITINGKKSLTPRWQLIEKNLKRNITNIYELKESIMSYNTKYESQWNFEVLYQIFEEDLDENFKTDFFSKIYPEIVKIALNLPNLITKPIPLLKSSKAQSISLSQMQIASLLANAFLCTFPRRNKLDSDNEYHHFPNINFNLLFSTNTGRNKHTSYNSKAMKLRCILHYFQRVTERSPEGVVTFTRRVLPESDQINNIDWSSSECQFKDVELRVDSTGSIFSSGADSIKVDFANKYVGGGILGNGTVQEEILFATQPELIVARLFTECLGDRETLLVQGTELFCLHSGYGRSFKFQGDFVADMNSDWIRDRFGRWRNTIVMVDALPFMGSNETRNQFGHECISRELNKAYCGFSDVLMFPGSDEEHLPKSVSTGNWGCGAFGGDVRLKFLIQLMVCAQANKNITYYTFNEPDLVDDIYRMFHYLHHNGFSVGTLWRQLIDFAERPNPEGTLLFDYIQYQQ